MCEENTNNKIPKKKLQKSARIHIYKTITWRVLASLTTFILSYLFFKDDDNAIQKATGLALTEAALKMIFYYLHERIWYRSIYKLGQEAEKE